MHSYEEIRDVSIDILLNREQVDFSPDQWANFTIGIAQVFARREGRSQPGRHHQYQLDSREAELARDVFWDLFRQGFITLGLNDANPQWPFFRVSHFGNATLAHDSPYRFTDSSTYLTMVREHVPDLDNVTEMYLDEAVRAFHAGCLLSASVMLGVATESRFLLLIRASDASALHGATFRPVAKERTVLQQITKFRNLIAQIKDLPPAVREDLDTNFSSIQALIRTFRNEAGHPTGKTISREQMYVLLQLFPPYARKLAQIEKYFHVS
jgi:hypothetical protein